MEEFYLKVYLFKPNRLPPIKIAKDSQLKITIETMDYTIPPGATASAFATGVTSEKVYTQTCTVSGNKVSFTPVPGFFVQGRNLLQYEIGGGVIPLAIDVNCEISLPSTGETGEPETVKPLVQRAEAAAAKAEEKANAAAGSAQAAQDYLQKTQEISVNPAYIGDNGNWFTWGIDQDSYVDSGVKAQGPKGDPGAVQTVCGVAPDASGNVPLNAGNVGALPLSGGTMTGVINMNGQPISGLSDPTEDTQAANKGYVDTAARKAAPRNLLDNSDFRNPVNQRGQTSYSGEVYSIDRWKLFVWSPDGSGTANLSVESNGIRLYGGTSSTGISSSCNITQRLDASKMLGKIYTIAVSIKSLSGDGRGRVVVGYDSTFVVSAYIKIGINILTFAMPSSASTFYVEIGNSASQAGAGAIDALIEWAALYEGEYTAETLPEYQPKGYGAELVECKRYFVKYQDVRLIPFVFDGTTLRHYRLIHDIPMRVEHPTIDASGLVERKVWGDIASQFNFYGSDKNGVTFSATSEVSDNASIYVAGTITFDAEA